MIGFTINDRQLQVDEGRTILDVAREQGIRIPTLCYHKDLTPYGACRLCLVEVGKGKKRRLTTSCNYPVQEGIEVFLDTDRVVAQRRVVLQLLLALAPASPEIAALAAEHGVTDTPFEKKAGNKCILCGLCNRVCKEIVGADAIGFASRGLTKDMTAPYDEASEACIGCGACVYVCPTNCIGMKEEDRIREITRWHRRLPMKDCKKCGRPWAPTFQLNAFADQIKVDRSAFDVCPDCR